MLAALLAIGASGVRKKLFLSQARIVALARETGFPDPELAAAVAMAESGGDAHAVGDDGKSIGLWQINMPAHPEHSASDLMDPGYNARAAFAVSNHGANWNPWTCYRNGAYKKFLPKGGVSR